MSIFFSILGLMPKAPEDGLYAARGGKWVKISDAADDAATDDEFNAAVDAAIDDAIKQ